MRIAALYIPEGVLPHVFGENHTQITLNFGGINLYTVHNGEISDIKPNPYYLDDIFQDGISLFSCIVGNNGGGKTSLLKLITSSWHCQYVIENESNEFRLTDNPEQFHRVYYTPYLNDTAFFSVRENGKDLSKHSLLKTDNHGDSDPLSYFLEAHFSESMKRWIKFNHFYQKLENVRVVLPTFERLTLSLKHFDLTIHQPDRFHNTPRQLRPAIKSILKTIRNEATEKEKIALEGHDPTGTGIEKIYFPVRFEYDLYEAALAKLVSIFEHSGNKYLEKGIIPEDFEEQIVKLDVRGCIQWFLENTGVSSGEEKYGFSQHIVLLELIDYIVSLLGSERVTDNWRKIIIHESEALRIIELYDEFNESFNNEWFNFDVQPLFGFRPDIAVSSGEQSFLNLFSTLYYHAENIETGIDIDEHNFHSLNHIQKDIILLLDEGDNAFHPQWKKAYVRYLRELLPLIFRRFNVQVIVTSHDPLTLSDLPKNNVVYLERIEGHTRLGSSNEKRTFGANIADLLKDSFFIKDGQIGDFVAQVIDGIIRDIRNNNISADRRIEIERIIMTIDEPVLRFKLAEMLAEVLGDRKFELQLIDEEIRRLEKRRGDI